MNIFRKKAQTWCKKNITFLNFAVLLIIVGFLFFILICKQYFKPFSTLDSKTASELGGFIGGFVGTFWSAATVILIYITFKKQSEFNKKQQFESYFFNMLNTFNSIIDKFKINATSSRHDECFGRDCFSVILNEFKHDTTFNSLNYLYQNEDIPEIKNFKNGGGKSLEELRDFLIILNMGNKLSDEFIIAHYEVYYELFKKMLGYYFRYLYNIFKYIIEENQNEEDIRRYLNIVQSQMSSDELGLLFYYALSKYSETKNGEKQLYSWLEEYDFLENMDSDSLMKKEHHKYYKTKFKFLIEEEKEQ